MSAPFVVFDLDGTLIDSRGSIAAACNHALARAGRDELPVEVIGGFVGDGARNLVSRAFALDPTASEVDAHLAVFLRFYEENPIAGTRWMPGAEDAMAACEAQRIALVTNKARGVTEHVLDALGIRNRFAVVVAGGDCPLKPSPAPIERAMAAMGCTPSVTWVVGDGIQDVAAGRAARCRTIAILGGFTADAPLRASGPDVLSSTLGS